jgi:tetratricopeptide (TPR) repeat protein
MVSGCIARYVTAAVMVLGLVALATPADAQTGMIKGKVVDGKGQPMEGVKIVISMKETASRRYESKSNKRGEFIQIGLTPGAYQVLAEKDGMSQQFDAAVKIGQQTDVNFQLVPGQKAGMPQLTPEQIKNQEALKGALDAAVAASQAKDHDTAITKFNEAITLRPDCASCYYGMGFELSQKKEYDKAEAALKKAIELKPDYGEAYGTLATIYNAQKKFDEAAKAGEEAAKYSSAGAAGGGGGADALYNQGVILWNAGKIADAKKMFEQVIAANPSHAEAHYQLGMANLNEGKMPEAVTAFEKYLTLAPDGPNAAAVKGVLSQIKK